MYVPGLWHQGGNRPSWSPTYSHRNVCMSNPDYEVSYHYGALRLSPALLFKSDAQSHGHHLYTELILEEQLLSLTVDKLDGFP